MNFSELLKNSNERRRNEKYLAVLHHVIRRPGISRSELIRPLGMSKNNVGATINAMLEDGLLCEAPAGREGSGRAPFGLRCAPELFFTIGAALTQEHAALVLIDSAGTIRDRRPLRHEGSEKIQIFLEEIRQKCKSMLQTVDPAKVLGIGTVLPGYVDFHTGTVMWSQAFPGIGDFNLKQFLKDELGLESYLINEAHIRPLMEKLHGGATELEDFVTVDDGLGAGFFFNGALYRGWQHRGGELGRMKITENTVFGDDGRNGLLYSLGLPRVTCDKLRMLVSRGGRVSLRSDRFDTTGMLPSNEIADAASRGDMIVAQLLSERFSAIGDALVNVAYLLNPQAIFLPGWTERCPECTLEVLRRKLGCYNQQSWQFRTEIRSSSCAPEVMPETAAWLFTDEFFKLNTQKES